MSVLVVHGVNVREPQLPLRISTLLRRYLDGILEPGFHIEYGYWGDLGARYRFGGASRPRTLYRKMGPGDGEEGNPSGTPDRDRSEDFVWGGPREHAPVESLAALDREDALEVLALAAEEASIEEEVRVEYLVRIEELRDRDSFWADLHRTTSTDGQIEHAVRAIDRESNGTYAEMGIRKLGDNIREQLSRATNLPQRSVAKFALEARPRMDQMLEQFVGDALTYLATREVVSQSNGDPQDRLGPIPARIYEALLRTESQRRASEPLVVISHSMGGQVVYDLATEFLPAMRADGSAIPTIDCWAATASQVGYFEELGLFLSSDPTATGRTTFDNSVVKLWWNLWDYHDLLSFTAAPIFEGVEDAQYSTGRGISGAHGGYLDRPSFYRQLAERVALAKKACLANP